MSELPRFDCSEEQTVGSIRSAVVRSGVAELQNCVSEGKADEWRSFAAKKYDEFSEQIRSHGLDPRNDKIRFREAMRRSPGRLDLRLDGAHSPGWWEALRDLEPLGAVVEALLGPKIRHLVSGIVVSQPGARAQHIHRDGGSGLFPEQPLPLPAYALTIFVPLTGFGHEYGPTEFYPGSWLVDPDDKTPAVAAQMESGTALLFDYRIPHRGGRHTGEGDRIYAYSVVARPWFGDHLNYNEPSLFA